MAAQRNLRTWRTGPKAWDSISIVTSVWLGKPGTEALCWSQPLIFSPGSKSPVLAALGSEDMITSPAEPSSMPPEAAAAADDSGKSRRASLHDHDSFGNT